MNNDIDHQLNEVKTLINEEPIVQEFFKLRDDIIHNQELKEISRIMHEHQKEMSLHVNNEEIYFREKKLYEEYYQKYHNHPLILNYDYIKEEVYNLLMQVSNLLR